MEDKIILTLRFMDISNLILYTNKTTSVTNCVLNYIYNRDYNYSSINSDFSD